MSYYLERIYLVQDNKRRLYNICADLIFGQNEKDALQTLNNIFATPEYHFERAFIYDTFCKRAESSDVHRQCLYHKGKGTVGKKIFSRNGSSAGTTVSNSRIRIQCVKCRLGLLFLDTQKLIAEGGQIERTSSRVCGNQVVSESSLPPGKESTIFQYFILLTI
ncbi:hypothetical protein EON65_36770 [archaeon]|nr:MAG: hypothetical protein EON65_36770 [archaeon]